MFPRPKHQYHPTEMSGVGNLIYYHIKRHSIYCLYEHHETFVYKEQQVNLIHLRNQ